MRDSNQPPLRFIDRNLDSSAPAENINMADGEEADVNAAKSNSPKEDILVNGDADNATNNNLLQPNDGTLPGQVMPRRSSLVKDQNRRTQGQAQAPKKTVSFSSMPNEKSVVNGKLLSRFTDIVSGSTCAAFGDQSSIYNLLSVNIFSQSRSSGKAKP